MANFQNKDVSKARDHRQSLAALCCICGRKCKDMYPVTKEKELLIRKHVLNDFDLDSGFYPTSICSSCRKYVAGQEKDPEGNRRSFPIVLNYNLIYPSGVHTRHSSGPLPDFQPGVRCNCALCDIARMNGFEYKAWHKAHSIPPVIQKREENKENSTTKMCKCCFTEVGRGKKHICGSKRKKLQI